MKLHVTKAPTFTKAITAAAVFAIVYLASTSSLPSCSDTAALLSSGGECIERQSFLHTGSGWLALICLITALVLLGVKYKDALVGRQAHEGPPAQQARGGPSAAAPVPGSVPAPGPGSVPAPGPAPGFCRKCGTRIIAGDRFCQGCGVPMGSLTS